MDAREINVAVAEAQFGEICAFRDFGLRISDFIHPSAFLLFLRIAGVEDHAVAGFERALRVEHDARRASFATSPRNTPRFLPKRAWTSAWLFVPPKPAGVTGRAKRPSPCRIYGLYESDVRS